MRHNLKRFICWVLVKFMSLKTAIMTFWINNWPWIDRGKHSELPNGKLFYGTINAGEVDEPNSLHVSIKLTPFIQTWAEEVNGGELTVIGNIIGRSFRGVLPEREHDLIQRYIREQYVSNTDKSYIHAVLYSLHITGPDDSINNISKKVEFKFYNLSEDLKAGITLYKNNPSVFKTYIEVGKGEV